MPMGYDNFEDYDKAYGKKNNNRFLFWRFLFCAAIGFFLAAIVVKVFYEVLLKLF